MIASPARAAVLLALVLLVVPGGAAPARASAAHNGRVEVESRVEAGYTARFAKHGSPLAVTATVTVPTLDCTATDAGIVTSVGVVEVPYRFAGGRIYAHCSSGAAAYEARLESSTGGSEVVEEATQPGDRIKIIAKWNGSVGLPKVDVTMISLDRGWRADARFEFVADGFNAAVFREAPMWIDGAQLPIADYTGARVQRARVDRESLGDLTPNRYVLVDADGDRLVLPSKITAGGGFRLSYVG